MQWPAVTATRIAGRRALALHHNIVTEKRILFAFMRVSSKTSKDPPQAVFLFGPIPQPDPALRSSCGDFRLQFCDRQRPLSIVGFRGGVPKLMFRFLITL